MTQPLLKPAQIQQFRDYLERHRLRFTQERQLILEQAFALKNHFRADDLLFQMVGNGYKTSKATIYRTLPLLVQSGLLTEIIGAQNQTMYEAVQSDIRQHAHLICVRCSEIIEFRDLEIKAKQQVICASHQFQPLKYRHEILGYCAQCSL